MLTILHQTSTQTRIFNCEGFTYSEGQVTLVSKGGVDIIKMGLVKVYAQSFMIFAVEMK